MRMKSGLAAAVGIACLIAIGTFGYEIRMETMRTRQHQERIEREQTDARAFASCVAQQLSPGGLEKLVVHQYKPAGLVWQTQIKFAAERNFGAPLPPSGDQLFAFKREGRGMDWEPFRDLVKRCNSTFGPPFDDRWRWWFWESLENEPSFKDAAEKVKARNDSVLELLRKKEVAAKKISDNAESAQLEARNKELFRDEATVTKP